MEENGEKKQQQVWWKKRTSVTVDETTPLTGNAVSPPEPDVDLDLEFKKGLRHRSIGSFSEIDEGYMSSYSFRDFSDNLAQSIPYMAR